MNRIELTNAELREVQLDLLDSILSYCRSQGLCVMLAYGTLLGAVRHRGYIPWDDDVDLMMPRKDFERFARADPAFGNEQVRIGTPLDRSWPFPYIKVMRTDTVLVENSDLNVDLGVKVDIFPIDGVPAAGPRAGLHLARLAILRMLMAAQAISDDPNRSKTKRLLLRVAKWLAMRFDRSALNAVRSRLARTYDPFHAPRAGVLVGEGLSVASASSFRATVDLLFEGRQCPVPTDYDAVLTATYGDYMTPPAADGRVTHHSFKAYIRH